MLGDVSFRFFQGCSCHSCQDLIEIMGSELEVPQIGYGEVPCSHRVNLLVFRMCSSFYPKKSSVIGRSSERIRNESSFGVQQCCLILQGHRLNYSSHPAREREQGSCRCSMAPDRNIIYPRFTPQNTPTQWAYIHTLLPHPPSRSPTLALGGTGWRPNSAGDPSRRFRRPKSVGSPWRNCRSAGRGGALGRMAGPVEG